MFKKNIYLWENKYSQSVSFASLGLEGWPGSDLPALLTAMTRNWYSCPRCSFCRVIRVVAASTISHACHHRSYIQCRIQFKKLGVVDTGENWWPVISLQFLTGIMNPPCSRKTLSMYWRYQWRDLQFSVCLSSKIFERNWNDTNGLGGNWLMKKNWICKSCDTVPLKSGLLMSKKMFLLNCCPHTPAYKRYNSVACGGGSWRWVLYIREKIQIWNHINKWLNNASHSRKSGGRAQTVPQLQQIPSAVTFRTHIFCIFWTAFYELYSPCLPLAAHCPRFDVIGGDGGATVVDRRLPFDRHRSFVPVEDFRCRGRQGDGWKYKQGWS